MKSKEIWGAYQFGLWKINWANKTDKRYDNEKAIIRISSLSHIDECALLE